MEWEKKSERASERERKRGRERAADKCSHPLTNPKILTFPSLFIFISFFFPSD